MGGQGYLAFNPRLKVITEGKSRQDLMQPIISYPHIKSRVCLLRAAPLLRILNQLLSFCALWRSAHENKCTHILSGSSHLNKYRDEPLPVITATGQSDLGILSFRVSPQSESI